MKTSSRFVVAIHIMTMLSLSKKKNMGAQKSGTLAKSVNTNPVVVRRIVGLLSKAGLIASKPGSNGGFELAQSPEKTRLLDIYYAVEEKGIFSYHHNQPSITCTIGCNIQDVLGNVLGKAEEALENVLAKVTIDDILTDILKNCNC